ncbi:PucR family transcriptional regulator [Nonomuraea sp. NPDC049655]|uniref:PucR family transcriptional regulator n=1 Tax=Nonomuraea sp. NPDC049655 TaxID=3364355 RepID=UPI0037AC4253
MKLRQLAGAGAAGALDAEVRWVAVSELEDPTPFLEGSELLLTTGIRLEGDFSGYVARLVGREVAGLGFGVGLSHEHVPAALVAAADEAGLPLFEVPRETPFIAIGKVVSELLAAEQYDEITRAFAAQGRLTRAALRPEGMHAVIDRVAKEIEGWAALLDETGEVRHATPGADVPVVVAELRRLRAGGPAGPQPDQTAGAERPPTGEPAATAGQGGERVRGGVPGGEGVRGGGQAGERMGGGAPAGERVRGGGQAGQRVGAGVPVGARRRGAVQAGERVPASLALSGPDEHVVIQPLGGGPRPRGFFAVGARKPFSPVTHTVINAAGSLLTLAMEQGRAQREAGRRLRSAVLELLLGGAVEQARAVAGTLGARLPGEPLVVLAAGAAALETLEPHGFTALLDDGTGGHGGADGGGHGGAQGGAHGGALGGGHGGGGRGRGGGFQGGEPVSVCLVSEGGAEKVAREVEGPVGLSSPCRYDGLRDALDQARRALAHSDGGLTRFADLAGQGLLALLDADTLRAFSGALLAPLTAYGSRADLVESLRAYLDSNGHWDAAAQRLGVHRHTLRYRMRRVAELLGRDLDDPGVRAELWLALEAARR